MPYRLIDPARNPRMRALLHVIGGLASGILLVGVVVMVPAIYSLVDAVRDTQVNNTARAEKDRIRDEQTAAAAEAAARAVQRIEDCTTPGRQCFDDGQKRTGAAVAGINQATLDIVAAALACQADGILDIDPLARCIAERAQEQRRPLPSDQSPDRKPRR